ncbi:MAG: AraC family transcriptional regulator [Gammaproteobacteria bacterium]|nr:AraC family transcriptional regulator [Gammaproteobacteria bacterium]
MQNTAATATDYRMALTNARDRSALDTWTERLSAEIATMHIDITSADSFKAGWQHFVLGPLSLNFLQARPQRVHHMPAMTQGGRGSSYDLLFFKRNGAQLDHCGKRLTLTEDSFVLLDNRHPYDLTITDDSVAHTVHLEDDWLRLWVANPEVLVAAPIASTATWGAPLAALLDTIYSAGLNQAPVSRSTIADQLGSLIALMAGTAADGSGQHHDDLFHRACRLLREHYTDRDINPTLIADRLGISKRHLHGIFARAGTTLGTRLLDIRLASAAQMLADRHHRHLQIGELAGMCGFDEQSHFARRFKQKYGLSPLQYRRQRCE